ncbi:MAG: iron-containing alcohol dehydrogenase [Methylobacteriaceae bacterium]|nr:iron-containing alcohol dehydrogenase [Methylobacteriaceae bacterium]
MPTISYLTTIRFDFGAISGLPDDLRAVGIRRPLLVTDRGVIAAGLAERILALLPDGLKSPVFSEVPSNPTETAVQAGLSAYRAGDCDGLVAVGGGSPIDLAKAVAILATHPGPLDQYMFVNGGIGRITGAVAPLIAIPTTAGTGSEVGRGALISLDDGRKLAAISPFLIPKRAICDPDLTLALPPALTAGTGMDALTHCVECFISPIDNPPAGAIALDGAERIARYLVPAVENGANRTARWEMLMGAMEGAMAFQKGLGAVHALSHPLGALRSPSLHHGTLNAVLLPHVLRFNRAHVGTKYARLAVAMGLSEGADLADFVASLNRRIGLPASLGAMGVSHEVVPWVAEQAMLDHCTPTNPRKPTREDYVAILEAAL